MKRKAIHLEFGPSSPSAKRTRAEHYANRGFCCVVPRCSNRTGQFSFHRFPAAEDRRKAWIGAIRRDPGESFAITANTRVCSAHFLAEDYSSTTSYGTSPEVRRLKTTAVPSVFPWTTKKKPRRVLQRTTVEAPARSSKRQATVTSSLDKRNIDSVTVTSEGQSTSESPTGDSMTDIRHPTPAPHLDHDYVLRGIGDACVKHIEQLEETVAGLQGELRKTKKLLISLDSVKDDDDMFKHVTGLPNYATFKALMDYFAPKAKYMKWWRGQVTMQGRGKGKQREVKSFIKLTLEEQFFAILVRLRTAVSVKEISHRCDISISSFSKMFTTWINFLASELRDLHKIPAAKPKVLIKSFLKFPNTRIVIDCTEVFCKRPSGLQARKQLFSNYKHHTTAKFLVGISPSGAILYVSDMWGGRASDKKITLECGLLDQLKPGHDVMADRGFTIRDELEANGIRLIIPSFLGSERAQLRAGEVTRTRRIAEARIHVERAIQRIKEFRLLQGEVDISLLHVLQQVFQVCAFLTNFQKPIVKDVVYVA